MNIFTPIFPCVHTESTPEEDKRGHSQYVLPTGEGVLIIDEVKVSTLAYTSMDIVIVALSILV
jgi:hypothetical protein